MCQATKPACGFFRLFRPNLQKGFTVSKENKVDGGRD
jgi:hypothetical protein